MEAVIKIILNKIGAETKLEMHIYLQAQNKQHQQIPQIEVWGG